MYFRLLFATALVAGVAAVPGAAPAQMACGARDAIIAKLSAKYGEVRRGGGLEGESAVFELFASSETGTWTLLRTSTSGVSCVMAVGDSWQEDAPKPVHAGKPA